MVIVYIKLPPILVISTKIEGILYFLNISIINSIKHTQHLFLLFHYFYFLVPKKNKAMVPGPE